jgi:hypothetical protein
MATERNQTKTLPEDGTRELLQWGGTILGSGLVALLLLQALLGGFSATGASTNTGWFALVSAAGAGAGAAVELEA